MAGHSRRLRSLRVPLLLLLMLVGGGFGCGRGKRTVDGPPVHSQDSGSSTGTADDFYGGGNDAASHADEPRLAFRQERSSPGTPRFVFTGNAGGISIRHEHGIFACCLEFSAGVIQEGDVLRVTEDDGDPTCGCLDVPWDVTITIEGLEPGSYDVYLHAKGGNLLATAALVVPETETAVFVRGAVNADVAVDMSDAVAALSYLFQGTAGAPCLDAVDMNDDGLTNIADPVYLLGFLFRGGPAPPAPYPSAGEDLTPDSIGCSIENTVVAMDFVRDGDFNGDGGVDLSDGVAFLAFLSGTGPPPRCEDALDWNDDGELTMDDVCLSCPACCPLLEGTSPKPAAPPSDDCGPDPTPDRLGCEAYRCEG